MRRNTAGLAAWLVQRLGALYMLVFFVSFFVYFLLRPIHSYPQWRAWAAQPAVGVALFIFFIALLLHMWVGLRDVLFDYVQPARLRPLLAAVLGVCLAALGVWLVWILIRAQYPVA